MNTGQGDWREHVCELNYKFSLVSCRLLEQRMVCFRFGLQAMCLRVVGCWNLCIYLEIVVTGRCACWEFSLQYFKEIQKIICINSGYLEVNKVKVKFPFTPQAYGD